MRTLVSVLAALAFVCLAFSANAFTKPEPGTQINTTADLLICWQKQDVLDVGKAAKKGRDDFIRAVNAKVFPKQDGSFSCHILNVGVPIRVSEVVDLGTAAVNDHQEHHFAVRIGETPLWFLWRTKAEPSI